MPIVNYLGCSVRFPAPFILAVPATLAEGRRHWLESGAPPPTAAHAKGELSSLLGSSCSSKQPAGRRGGAGGLEGSASE